MAKWLDNRIGEKSFLDRLFIEMPDTMQLELHAKTEKRFFLRGLSIDVDFTTEDGKELVKIIDGTDVQTALQLFEETRRVSRE